MSGRQDCRNGDGKGMNRPEISRREFLKVSGTAAAAVALGGAAVPLSAAGENLTVNGLPASVLGRTGLKVTKISFGGVLITEPRPLLHLIDQGFNFVHTSPEYQNGRSMDAFGKAFRVKGVREKVVLALKERPEKLDECLKVLNTDYVDMLVPPLTSMRAISDERLPEEFEKVKKAGKAGFLGWAGHSNTTEMFDRGRELGWFDVTLMAYSNIKSPDFLAAARRANEAGIGIFTMKGLPKRNVDGSDPEVAATATSLTTAMLEEQYAHSVLASMGSFQSIEFYRDMLATRLGLRDRELEHRYWASQECSYCAMCGACEKVCPDAVEITRALRYRMYYHDYGLKDYARSRYASLGRVGKGFDIRTVELCESVCTRRLPIGEMLRDARAVLS